MAEYRVECFRCTHKFAVSFEESIPYFDQADKSEWKECECPSCGCTNKIARLSDDSDLLCSIVD